MKTPFILAAGLWLATLVVADAASADDLASYSVVAQFGHDSAPTAIEIAPDGQWFATAKPNEIYLWDIKSDQILRRIAPPDAIGFLSLSKDGALVLAKNEAGKLWAWKAETGALASTAAAAAAQPMAWSDLQHFGEGKLYLWKDADAREYLARNGIDGLVPPAERYEVMETNQRDAVEVDYPLDTDDGPVQGAAFVDIANKTLLVKYTGPVDGGDCGSPWGTFAFDGRRLVLAPTAKDASSFFSSAEVVDIAADPKKLLWQHECRDFQVAGIEMRDGLIFAQYDPTKMNIWDPASGQALARITDIGPAEGDGQNFAMSGDRRTIAYARVFEGAGRAAGVSVLKDGQSTFYPTRLPVRDVRLSADGLTAFAQTAAGWQAWSVSTGAPTTGTIEPPAAVRFLPDVPPQASPDGEFHRVEGQTGRGLESSTITDATGRTLFTIPGEMRFAEDSLHGWSESTSQAQSVDFWDLKTGRRLWTATEDQNELVMEFPDGRVRLSNGAEERLRLVRGFDVRPFDDEAKRVFLER